MLIPEGTHLLIDCYGAADPGPKTLEFLRRLAAFAECKVLSEKEHVFPGGGRTAVLILSQSHISVHTWPEHQYVAFDLFSCKKLSPVAVAAIAGNVRVTLGSKREVVKEVSRGDAVRA